MGNFLSSSQHSSHVFPPHSPSHFRFYPGVKRVREMVRRGTLVESNIDDRSGGIINDQRNDCYRNNASPSLCNSFAKSSTYSSLKAFAGSNGPVHTKNGSDPVQYGHSKTLGLHLEDFINVYSKSYTGRIELFQGSVEGLAEHDNTDILIVYLCGRGVYKANRDSSLAALNSFGISLPVLERESKIPSSYRRHYHCWISRKLPKPRPIGFEFTRLLVYEDPGEELTRDDNIVLDIVKCLTTVVGRDTRIQSVLIPLSGELLFPSLRKHFVKAAVMVSYAWMKMGLPLRTVKVLLPHADVAKDVETFRKLKEALAGQALSSQRCPLTEVTIAIYFSYAQEEKETARDMILYLRSRNPEVRIYETGSQQMSVRKRGVVDEVIMKALRRCRVFLALLSDDYFNSVECTEAFSLAYCRDFESERDFMVPLYWRSCDLTRLDRRLLETGGVDSREECFENAFSLLDHITSASTGKKCSVNSSRGQEELKNCLVTCSHDDCAFRLRQKFVIRKAEQEESKRLGKSARQHEGVKTASIVFFDTKWRNNWEIDAKDLVFGSRLGAGSFEEVYSCKYGQKSVAVKILKIGNEEEQEVIEAHLMVEMKLMSKLLR